MPTAPDSTETKTSKATKREKIRLAYWMVEQEYPMTREATLLRAVVKGDLRRFGQTGSY